MLLRVVRELEYYTPRTKLICPNCELYVCGFDFIYQCPRGKISEHDNGYALCYKCAAKQIAPDANNTSNTTLSVSNASSTLQANSVSSTTTSIMYQELIKMVDGMLDKQGDILYNNINEEKTNQAEIFDDMVTFSEFIANDSDALSIGLRQDNENLLTFPNTFKFMNSSGNGNSAKIMKNISKYKLRDFCDSRIYLSSLIIVANTLNESFHDSVQNMVKHSKIDGCEFRGGPIKQLSRAQAKAESDYSMNPFPTSSHIIDLVRCTLVYNDCKCLMDGMNSIKNMIEKQADGKNGCIKKILRIKNMFLQNKQLFGGNEWLKQYNDIKWNVLIEKNGSSMIGEIQFMLKIILK